MKQGGAPHDKLAEVLRGAGDNGDGGGHSGLESRARFARLAVVLGDELVQIGDGFLRGGAKHSELLNELLTLLLVVVLGDGAASGPDVFQALCGGEQAEDGGHVLVHFLVGLVGEELDGGAGGRAGGEERHVRRLERRWAGNVKDLLRIERLKRLSVGMGCVGSGGVRVRRLGQGDCGGDLRLPDVGGWDACCHVGAALRGDLKKL